MWGLGLTILKGGCLLGFGSRVFIVGLRAKGSESTFEKLINFLIGNVGLWCFDELSDEAISRIAMGAGLFTQALPPSSMSFQKSDLSPK